MKIKLVVATQLSQQDFFDKSATGRSTRRTSPPNVELRLAPNNKMGLPTVYNWIINESANDPAILIFSHDDLHFLDFHWAQRVVEGLNSFEIIGVAGNKSRIDRQPGWAFVENKNQVQWDKPEHLSGTVAHGKLFPPENISHFGPARQQVKLLDGVFLACHSQTLIEKNIRFDELFDFHFYDLDFCRQAEDKGVTCGTWDISVMHESGGRFGSPAWQKGYQKYMDKWGK